ncbi:hypothetical protein [Azospirillum agricola]|uniref:hypothetical protein n=1 Tax=Azospirillum agricola TaxID=1720247 RepID=UPI000A0F29B2|nr:hypothetical protein [Azospirillum agricola]SMH60656.1 hypothetical protein SAMN02982994_5676 [Azospirillum lipoferum]
MAEPTLTDVMNAILDLGRHVNERLDRTEERLDIRIDRLDARIDALQSEVKEGFSKVHSDLRVLDARLDEQRQTLNALIPTQIAAIPPAAE